MSGTLLPNVLAFYEEDPHDPFNIYALAIEYAKTDRSKASHYFNILLTEHPGYLPTYYHAGAFFAEAEEPEKAEEFYQKGVELARIQGNAKALSELLRAYNNFLDELDD
ncbi:tetratricopeptide repeat protein [Dyadobacter aurulentus]|uniref:tetratricopeptide repeat protein n=1 Tax=Dyadobacter sp. UC 10 TaxID=2605428 RepID=UPI0011F0B80F|nr:tetratricopeptide repeat protein [Dyadobacter sp. UC 10]KAA0993045.1 tetratricopeptide repeat protein [Dyadobacter sp. UC 10]